MVGFFDELPFLCRTIFFCFFNIGISFSLSPSSSARLHFTPVSDLCFLGFPITSPFVQRASISLAWACISAAVSCFHLHSPALSTLHSLRMSAVFVICEGL